MRQLSLELPDLVLPVPSPRHIRSRPIRRIRSTSSARKPATLSVELLLPGQGQEAVQAELSLTVSEQADSGHEQSGDEQLDGGLSRSARGVIYRQEERYWEDADWLAVLSSAAEGGESSAWVVNVYRQGEEVALLTEVWPFDSAEEAPLPLNSSAANALFRTAQQLFQRRQAALHQRLDVFARGQQWEVRLDISPDEYLPQASLSARAADGEHSVRIQVGIDFSLNASLARQWIEAGFESPQPASD